MTEWVESAKTGKEGQHCRLQYRTATVPSRCGEAGCKVTKGLSERDSQSRTAKIKTQAHPFICVKKKKKTQAQVELTG
jgi:hypothetical protein